MIAYLISAQAGDRPPGLDIALIGSVTALKAPAVQRWMDAQGYGPEDPDECMYLATEPAPEGFPARRVRLGDADTAALLAALDERAGDEAKDPGAYRAAVAALRLYREVHEGRDGSVRTAHAAGVTVHGISQLSGISRGTIYKILEESP